MKGSKQSSKAESAVGVLIDTNVFIDVLTERKDKSLTENAGLFLDFTSYSKNFKFYVSTLAVGTVFYFLKKISKTEKKKKLDCLLRGIEVVDTRKESYAYVWESGFKDLEDAMQDYCAISSACSCIVTDDIKDYKASNLEILSPKEFLEKYTY